MPYGYLFVVLLVGICLLLQLIATPRVAALRSASFWTSMVVNEQPHWFAIMLIASTVLAFAQDDIDSGPAWVAVVLAGAVIAGLLLLLLRAFPSRRALEGALESLEPGAARQVSEPKRYAATLLGPYAYGRGRVERIADLRYGPAGERNLLDVYRPRNREVTGPVLIYLHGGSFKGGNKKRESQLMLNRLAGNGWSCVTANYRLSPEGQFPDYVIDLKRVIDWVRKEGRDLGACPERIFLAGGSAGGHIAATAALTANEPLLQPGFEAADTSVAGVIGLYGYYGKLNFGGLRPRGPLPSSPRELVHRGAPPFLMIHGDRDTVVGIDHARKFASRLREAEVPVAFAELPWAQHTFDLLRSARNENAVDAIQDFAAFVESSPRR